jgi:phthalate 4,5-cis-dihydrodiol dehydrogenase
VARIRLGIAGVGIAALQVGVYLPKLKDDLELTALADLRRDNMEFFCERYGKSVTMFGSVEEMCRSPEVDAIWVATPNALHAEHTILCAQNGKHVICEKPMAVTLEQCQAMVEAVERHNVKYVQGHSKTYDVPIRKMGEIVRSGELGRVTHIQTWNYNDWLIRALVANEVDTEQGAGVVFRQGPHQIDVVRFLAGGRVRSVRAITGRWAPHFPKCEGNYTALLEFENGVAATLVFDGYGFFDVTELTWGYGESGYPSKNPDSTQPRYRPAGPVTADEKFAQVRAGNPYGYGAGGGYDMTKPQKEPFFGLTVVSFEKGVVRQSPDGLFVYGAEGRREITLPPSQGRAAELIELCNAVKENRAPALDARWGMATAEVCLAILESSRTRRDVLLHHQSDAPTAL